MITFDLSLVQLLSSNEGGGGGNTFLIWFNSNLSLNLVITETGKGCIWLKISKNLIVLQKKENEFKKTYIATKQFKYDKHKILLRAGFSVKSLVLFFRFRDFVR